MKVLLHLASAGSENLNHLAWIIPIVTLAAVSAAYWTFFGRHSNAREKLDEELLEETRREMAEDREH